MIHVLSEVMKRKTVDSYCFIVISKCYDLHVLFFLNTFKSSFKANDLLNMLNQGRQNNFIFGTAIQFKQ